MRRFAGVVGMLVMGAMGATTVACDSGAEVAALREQVRGQDEKIAALQTRVDEIAAALASERDARLREAAVVEAREAAVKLVDAAAPATTGAEALAVCPGVRCTVSRKHIEALLADPAAALAQARIMPGVQSGVTVGVKLYALRPGSLASAAGLKNGDLITEVNGKPLASIEDAMAAYRAIPLEGEIKLKGERKGAPLELTVVIGP